MEEIFEPVSRLRMELAQTIAQVPWNLDAGRTSRAGHERSTMDDFCSIASGVPRDRLHDGIRAPDVRQLCDHRRCAHRVLCDHVKSNDLMSLVNDDLAVRNMSAALMSTPTLVLRWPSMPAKRAASAAMKVVVP
jgi:hypothetical protein